jgi:cytochrome b subunit of formate dehydrogenase
MLRDMVLKYRRERSRQHTYLRFTTGQTVGHFVLTICFIVLVITGFALRYPENPILRLMFISESGLALRSQIHRIAGIGLIIVTFVHILHTVFSRRGRQEIAALMLRPRDLLDALKNFGFALGLVRRQPKFDRYGYSEKLEYWGMMWGSVVMIVTGLCMWFAGDFLRHFPKVVLDVMALIHFYEAWLAFGTIVVWHFYYMIFSPEAYPMNMSWLTGRITMEDFKERHPLEYERVIGEEGLAEAPANPGRPESRPR